MNPVWQLQSTAQFHDKLRFLKVMPAAFAATLLLIWGMERLIHAGDTGLIEEPPVYKVPDPVMPQPKPLEVLYQKPEPPKPVEIEPAPPELKIALAPQEGSAPPLVAPPTPPGRNPIGIYANDMPIPTMLVQPVYPAAAANRGIEGYVDVQFDVAETGATDNIVIVAAVPPQLFERETMKAVKRWKFNPVVKDGKPVSYKGLVQRVHFQMQKS